MKRLTFIVNFAALVALGWGVPVHGDAVTEWNTVTLNCVQGPPNPPNRGGPPGLMDIALVQLAVHDAVQAIQGRFQPYQYENPALLGAGSASVAAATAAYRMLVGLYGADDPCLAGIADPAASHAGNAGVQAGMEAAAALLPLYRPAMTLPTDPFLGGTGPGQWRPTPTAFAPGANGYMAVTAPFVMLRPSQFRPPSPPPLVSERYAREYEEVRLVGSANSAVRTVEQTDLARFWSVNFITQWYATLRGIAGSRLTDVGDSARLFALAGAAAADSQISAYDAKYHFNYWRPVTAIWEGDHDGNPRTVGDAGWTPFVTTPPYPDYHSGANMLTASITGILRLYFGTDAVAFSVSSSAAGLLVNPRQYTRLRQVEQELVDVRIYQGIHFRSADEIGRFQGGRLAHWTFMNYLKPVARN